MFKSKLSLNGEIGRRAAFRVQSGIPGVGSSPSLSTIKQTIIEQKLEIKGNQSEGRKQPGRIKS